MTHALAYILIVAAPFTAFGLYAVTRAIMIAVREIMYLKGLADLGYTDEQLAAATQTMIERGYFR